MGATIKSPGHADDVRRVRAAARSKERGLGSGRLGTLRLAVTVALLCLSVAVSARDFVREAEAKYRAARTEYATNSKDFKTALKLAVAAFDFGELARDDDEREVTADYGIEASRQAVALNDKSAEAHYYLALNIAQLARTKMWGALKLIHEMEREFKQAIELDGKVDYAGAYRALGLLYMEAPGPPVSVGSKPRGRAYLERAVELAPHYPDNHLTLMEGLLKWRDREALAEKAVAYEKILAKAKKEFSEDEWKWEWTDWNQRWEVLQAKVKRK